jgi:hypothetical protein
VAVRVLKLDLNRVAVFRVHVRDKSARAQR